MKLFTVLAVIAFIGLSMVDARAVRDVKSDLIKKGQDLLTKADEAIKKLETEKKTHEVTVVKSEEARIKKLISDLEAATDSAKVTQIEHDLKAAEHKLTFELQKIQHGSHGHGNNKEQLLKRAKTLEKQAEDAIKKLKEEKKDTEAATVEKDEALVKKLVKDLEEAKEGASLTHIEHELAAAEHRLAAELRKLHPHTPARRDVKDDLIKKGKDLLTKADEAIKKLEADKKTHDVATLKSEESRIKKLTADLEAATDAAKVTHIEHDLSRAEHRLEHHLQRLSKARRDVKDDLIKKGKDLLTKADEAIKKLETDKKTHEVAIVKSEESRIKKLIADLEAATDAAKVTHIEHDLTRAEHKLAHELEKINKA